MCFIKSSNSTAETVQADVVQRHQADSSLTKTSAQNTSGYKQNIKTAPLGLQNEAVTQKKTLLGE